LHYDPRTENFRFKANFSMNSPIQIYTHKHTRNRFC